jgi:DNA-binding MarR family transcriptional regulator
VGLTEGQPKILDFLLNNDGCIQREIAENCKIKPATVTSLLANMEKYELIYRAKNSENRRILNVFLTDIGKKAHTQVEKIFYSIEKQCFTGFSEKEKVQTIDILNRLCKNLLAEDKGND